MTTKETRNRLGITVAKDLRTVMQGKVAIAGEASYEGPGEFSTAQLIGGQRCLPSVRAREMCRRRCVPLEPMVFRCPCAAGDTIGREGR